MIVSAALAAGLTTASHYITFFNIGAASMAPTLLDGDRVIVRRNSAFGSGSMPGYRRGDLVIFTHEDGPDSIYVKRVVGLPGDHIRFEGQRLWLNGEAVERVVLGPVANHPQPRWLNVGAYRERLDAQTEHTILIEEIAAGPRGAVTVPPGHYFVMGDNRNFSNDSRFLGVIPARNVVGRPFFIWWSAETQGSRLVRWSRLGNWLS